MFGRIDNRGLIRQFFVLLFILIVASLALWLWLEMKNPKTKIQENSLLSHVLKETQQALQEESFFIDLFFGSKDQSILIVEEREIKKEQINTHQQIRHVLLELIKGPHTDLAPTIPPDTRLRSIYIDKDKVGYVDFSSEIVLNHSGGSWAEVVTVYSIVNTIMKNFSEIKKVKLLINGEEIETLKGHLDMRGAFSLNEFLSYPQSFF